MVPDTLMTRGKETIASNEFISNHLCTLLAGVRSRSLHVTVEGYLGKLV